jgi:hypothetical protein
MNGSCFYSSATILQACLNAVADLLHIYQSLSAIVEIVQPLKTLLLTIAETSKCNGIVTRSREVLSLIDTIETACLTHRQPLVQGKEQTKMIRLYEPRFGPVYVVNIHSHSSILICLISSYEGKKSTRVSKEYDERLRLRRKHKREFKSTTRALVQDNQFIAREELRQQMEKQVPCFVSRTHLIYCF